MTEGETTCQQTAGTREVCKSRTWYWLAHPLIVTLFGGLIVAGLTMYWDHRQTQHGLLHANERAVIDRQTNIIEDLPSSFEATFGSLNHWFAKLLLVAKEKNGSNNSSRITNWIAEIRDLEREYHVNSPNGLLSLASYLFRCKDTRDTAHELKDAWTQFQEYYQKLIRNWNRWHHLDNAKIEDADQFRRDSVDEMNQLAQDLWDKMGREVDPTRASDERCN